MEWEALTCSEGDRSRSAKRKSRPLSFFADACCAASATAIHNLQQRRQTDVWLFFPCSLALTQVLQLGKTQHKSY